MKNNLEIIDFHTHIMSLSGLEQIFPESRKNLFFTHVVPIVEPIADLTEGIHDQLLRMLAMNFNDKFSRFVYSQFGQLFLMEALRLFKRHGLERLVHSMDRLKISHSVIYSIEPLTNSQELIDETTSKYPGRFSVFASVPKGHPDQVGYLLPLIEARTIRGIKIHPMVGGYEEEDLYESTKEYVALASEYELPVCLHTGHIPIEALTGHKPCIEISAFEPLIKAFPDCTFVLNHTGWESWRAAIQMAREHQNIVVETSWQPARIIRKAVKQLGAERVVFGSDYPLFQQWQALAEVERALDDREFELVVSKNAKRLLKIAPVLTESRA